MKRKLSEDEKKFVNKNLKKRKEDLASLKDTLFINKKTIELQNVNRKYEDETREIKRKQKDISDKIAIEQLNSEIEETENIINDLNKQLKEGVEEREALGTG